MENIDPCLNAAQVQILGTNSASKSGIPSSEPLDLRLQYLLQNIANSDVLFHR